MQGTEVGDQIGVQEVVGAAECAERHRAPGEVPDGADGLGCFLCGSQGALRMWDQHLCRFGQDELAVGAHEQRRPQLVLEPADLLRQARLGDEVRIGRGGQRAVLHRREKVLQLLEGDRRGHERFSWSGRDTGSRLKAQP
jgi:hypothetical protein